MSEATVPPLTTETLWDILNDVCDDEVTHRLIWHHLGYRFQAETQTWDASLVDPDWRDLYPEPPQFIQSRPASVKLTRSIPAADKHLLKDEMGFKGYKVEELVPRKTRRATIVSWLLSYRRQRDQGESTPETASTEA